MGELDQRVELFGPKSLSRRESRSIRKSTLSKLSHVGITLNRIDKEERDLHRDFLAVESAGTERDPYGWVTAKCALVSAMDKLRERRRILLGIPLPSANGSKRRLLDMPPAPVRDAVLIPEHPPVNGADSAIPTA